MRNARGGDLSTFVRSRIHFGKLAMRLIIEVWFKPPYSRNASYASSFHPSSRSFPSFLSPISDLSRSFQVPAVVLQSVAGSISALRSGDALFKVAGSISELKSGDARLNVAGSISELKSGEALFKVAGSISELRSGDDLFKVAGSISELRSGDARLKVAGLISELRSGEARFRVAGSISEVRSGDAGKARAVPNAANARMMSEVLKCMAGGLLAKSMEGGRCCDVLVSVLLFLSIFLGASWKFERSVGEEFRDGEMLLDLYFLLQYE